GPLPTCTSTAIRGFQPLGSAGGVASHGGIAPAGSSMAAVWENPTGAMGNGAGSIYLALVDNQGRVAPAQQIATGQDPVLLRSDRLSLFWRQGTNIMFQHVADDGSTPDPPVTVYNAVADYFDVAWDGQSFGIVMNGAGADQYEINSISVAPDGTLLAGPTKVPDGGNNSVLPAIAWAGSYYAVAWADTRPGSPAIFYARFDRQWNRLAPDEQLSPAGLRGSFPSVAQQATGGVVVCYQVRVTATNDDVYCSRLDDAGHVTASPQLSKTAYASQDPTVVTHGHSTWVVWDEATAAGEQTLNWQFLDDSGMPILATPYDNSGVSPGSRPHAAVGPDALYLTQYDLQNNGSTNAEVFTINCF
ncbi:MAG TPA: hypothetical protein VFF06_20760, partial [Polyangia bacterium]|nr:hypothetical protein [Polyangia bacterium]